MSLARTTLLADPPFAEGQHVTLGESDARHLRVLRLGVGERIGLRDGSGNVAEGTLVRFAKTQVVVEVDTVGHVEPPLPIHLLVPVADRERMLWLAEKAAELNAASWRPVVWQRSKSVSPRGDGPTFRGKVRARMVSALLQSRSAWLPELFPESSPELALAATPAGGRLALDASGTPVLAAHAQLTSAQPPVMTVAIGPEGGFEGYELGQLVAAGFQLCSLGASILRFETAAVAGMAIARAMLDHKPPTP